VDYFYLQGQQVLSITRRIKMTYELTGKNADSMIIVAHLDSGTYDYSEHGTVDAAAEALLSEWWTPGHELSRDDALAQCLESIEWYWPSEALAKAGEGYAWPLELGFVEAAPLTEDDVEGIREWANCETAEVDSDGDVWIEGPQTGHWLSAEKKAEYVTWRNGRAS